MWAGSDGRGVTEHLLDSLLLPHLLCTRLTTGSTVTRGFARDALGECRVREGEGRA